jgi:HAD superfamily hydrolase (TIGR01509 family)
MDAIEGIIFDMDGVLWDSTPMHAEAYRQVMVSLGVRDFKYRPYAGRRTLDVVRELNRERQLGLSDVQCREQARRKTDAALAMLRETNPIFPGSLETLRELARSRRLALASSASFPTVELYLENNGCRGLFHSVLSGQDVRKAKPAPEIYQRSCERLGLAPLQCLVVEDAVKGVEAGKAAGAWVAGVTTSESAMALRRAGADRIIAGLAELLS